MHDFKSEHWCHGCAWLCPARGKKLVLHPKCLDVRGWCARCVEELQTNREVTWRGRGFVLYMYTMYLCTRDNGTTAMTVCKSCGTELVSLDFSQRRFHTKMTFARSGRSQADARNLALIHPSNTMGTLVLSMAYYQPHSDLHLVSREGRKGTPGAPIGRYCMTRNTYRSIKLSSTVLNCG